MSIISVIVLVFSALGAGDYLFWHVAGVGAGLRQCLCDPVRYAAPYVFDYKAGPQACPTPWRKNGNQRHRGGIFFATSVSVTTVFSAVEKMNPKGVVLNAAFAVSASFALGSHLAFTMAYGSPYLWPMIIDKFISGVCAVAAALLLYKEKKGANE